jgi:hypothetical protein
MISILEPAANMATVRMFLDFVSPVFAYLSPRVAFELRGALVSSVDAVRRRENLLDAELALASLEPFDFRSLSPIPSKMGMEIAPFALRCPWGPEFVSPQVPFTCELVVFGKAAEFWPVWVMGASRLRIGNLIPLELAEASVAVQGYRIPAADLFDDPSEAIQPLAACCGPELQSRPALRVHLLSPTAWTGLENLTPDAPVEPEPFVMALFHRLAAIANCHLSPLVPGSLHRHAGASSPSVQAAYPLTETDVRFIEEAIIPNVAISGETLARLTTCHRSRSQRGSTGEYGGLIGHFDIGPRSKLAELPPDLVTALWLASCTGIGRSTAFGCGWIDVEPVPTRRTPRKPPNGRRRR